MKILMEVTGKALNSNVFNQRNFRIVQDTKSVHKSSHGLNSIDVQNCLTWFSTCIQSVLSVAFIVVVYLLNCVCI